MKKLHREWIRLYNSNLDCAIDLRRTDDELRQALKKWDDIQKKYSIAASTSVMHAGGVGGSGHELSEESELANQIHEEKYKDAFQSMIKDLAEKKRKKTSLKAQIESNKCHDIDTTKDNNVIDSQIQSQSQNQTQAGHSNQFTDSVSVYLTQDDINDFLSEFD